MLPDFFIVGAPKCGTTTLYHFLASHPEVSMSVPKELNFFSGKEILDQRLYYKTFLVKNLNEYKNHFKKIKNEKITGESSVSYLYYKEVPGKIHKLIPEAKIIIMLRDPVQRAVSHYMMDRRLGYVNIPFEDIVFKNNNSEKLELYYQQYIKLGMYYNPVKRYMDVFGEDQVWIGFTDDLNNNPETVLGDLIDFLGVSRNNSKNISEKRNVNKIPKLDLIANLYKSGKLRKTLNLILPDKIKKNIKKILFKSSVKQVVDKDLEMHLRKLYSEDILKLRKLVNKDLGEWV